MRHREALATAAGTSQVTALSLLVSMYLQSVYAASSEEIEIFLSPVASRSRVREAVRGLAATRQIHSLSMDAQTYYFLEDGLPEFAAPAEAPGESPKESPNRSIDRPGPVAPAMARAGISPALPAQRRDRLPNPVRPAAPLGRPGKPAPFAPRPGAGPSPARAEWTGPRRPTERPARAGAFRPDRTADKRPSRPPGRSFSPGTTGEPRTGERVDRSGPRPDPRGRVRPDTRHDMQPGKREAEGGRAEKRGRPAPWARTSPKPSGRPGGRPGEGSTFAPRPPRAGQGGHSSFRERPKPRFASSGGPKNRPDGDRARKAVSGRPAGDRSQGREERIRPAGRRPEGLPATAGKRPWAAKRSPGRSQGTAVPFRSGPKRSGPATPPVWPATLWPTSGGGTRSGGRSRPQWKLRPAASGRLCKSWRTVRRNRAIGTGRPRAAPAL